MTLSRLLRSSSVLCLNFLDSVVSVFTYFSLEELLFISISNARVAILYSITLFTSLSS